MSMPTIVLRGGVGPEQPVWDDCSLYTAEWYRRFQAWHSGQFPEVEDGTRSNIAMLVSIAEEREKTDV